MNNDNDKVSQEAMKQHVQESNDPVSGVPVVIEKVDNPETESSNADALRNSDQK